MYDSIIMNKYLCCLLFKMVTNNFDNLQVKRERDVKSIHLTSGTPWETVTLTTLARDKSLFTSLLNEARDAALREQEGKLVLYTAWGTEWRPFGLPRRKRPVGSVVLADGLAERIEGDVRAFLSRRKWYAERGKK